MVVAIIGILSYHCDGSVALAGSPRKGSETTHVEYCGGEELVNLGMREASVGTKINARNLNGILPCDRIVLGNDGVPVRIEKRAPIECHGLAACKSR